MLTLIDDLIPCVPKQGWLGQSKAISMYAHLQATEVSEHSAAGKL